MRKLWPLSVGLIIMGLWLQDQLGFPGSRNPVLTQDKTKAKEPGRSPSQEYRNSDFDKNALAPQKELLDSHQDHNRSSRELEQRVKERALQGLKSRHQRVREQFVKINSNRITVTTMVDWHRFQYPNIRVDEVYELGANDTLALRSRFEYVADHLVVKPKPEISEEYFLDDLRKQGYRVRSFSEQSQHYLVEVSPLPEAFDKAEAYFRRNASRFEYVAKDGIVRLSK